MSLDLIARLEAAAAGSDELDAVVIASLVDGTAAESPINGRWCVYVGADRHGEPRLWQPIDDHERDLRRAHGEERGPTRSLDTALLLVPEGVCWAVNSANPPKEYRAEVDWQDSVWAATAPLALCIACLHARQASPKEP